MKKVFLFALVFIMCVSIFVPAQAAGTLSEAASHTYYMKSSDAILSQYGKADYLSDTLTIAGSGMDQVRSYTVLDLESLAYDALPGLGYENTYSLLTSGSAYFAPVMTGLKLYDFLLYAGLDSTLPDTTPVKAISKDGYSVSFTLGQLRSKSYSRYSGPANHTPEETGLPALIAFGSNGLPLVGPAGTQAVTSKFTEEDGYSAVADNIGGPLRLVFGQTASADFNAPNCSKWLAALVIGDSEGYSYTREVPDSDGSAEPEPGGDWTHGEDDADFTVSISGTEAASAVTLSLAQLEGMTEDIVREYFACSAGKNAYEGVVLRGIIEAYMAEGLERPSKITVISSDGYKKDLDIAAVFEGIDSNYQPGKHKEIILAYAIDGVPLTDSMDSENYDGTNAYGPLRLIVENTVSAWVKNVSEIVIGEEAGSGFRDLTGFDWATGAISFLREQGVVVGTGSDAFSPSAAISRGDFALMLCRAYHLSAEGSGNFTDVDQGAYFYDAIAVCRALGIAKGDGAHFQPGAGLSRQDAITMLYRALEVKGLAPTRSGGQLGLGFSDAGEVSSYALDAVTALVDAGVINGKGGKLDPTGAMTRAQTANALWKALTKLN